MSKKLQRVSAIGNRGKPSQLRNPVARAPILRKGGAHGKSRSADRALVKKQVRQDAKSWLHQRGAAD